MSTRYAIFFQRTTMSEMFDQPMVCGNPMHLNLNSLPVKRQIDNPSPGAVTGGKSVFLALTREVNLDTLSFDSSEEEVRDWEVIPVPDTSDSLGEDAILIDIFTSRGYSKGQGVLISGAPILGNKVFCRYPGFTFQTFV